MLNCYKNIIKHFAQALNEQQMPVQEPEETVELTQAEQDQPIDLSKGIPSTIEIENGKILKHVGPLGKGLKHVEVYVDDSNAKYVVCDENYQDELEKLAAQSWVKQVESGALGCDAMPWEFIIEQGDTLGVLDSKTAEMVAKSLADASLDSVRVKQTAEAIWGNSLKSLAQQIISYYGVGGAGLTAVDDVKGGDYTHVFHYDFEI